MNVTESTALNIIADWILSGEDWSGREITDDEAKEALMKLSAQSFKRLSAGVHPKNIEAGWESRRFRGEEPK
jgi:hypothetical protein